MCCRRRAETWMQLCRAGRFQGQMWSAMLYCLVMCTYKGFFFPGTQSLHCRKSVSNVFSDIQTLQPLIDRCSDWIHPREEVFLLAVDLINICFCLSFFCSSFWLQWLSENLFLKFLIPDIASWDWGAQEQRFSGCERVCVWRKMKVDENKNTWRPQNKYFNIQSQ